MNSQDKDKAAVVDMHWLAEGTPDPFPDYIKRTREELPVADFSDDELASYAFMNYNRELNEEMAVMLGRVEGIPKIAFMTAVKERLRWLTRRLAVAEGRYPGVPTPGLTPMPELAIGGDDNRILTVNPDWCDWYESTFGTDTGSGFIRGKTLIDQVLRVMETVEETGCQEDRLLKQATLGAVHKMREHDPSRGLPEFRTIEEAEESVSGQRDCYFDKEAGIYRIDGYLNVKDLEGLLFAARAREMVAAANLEVPNIELVQVNQLRQVLHPIGEARDIDPSLFRETVRDSFVQGKTLTDEQAHAVSGKRGDAIGGGDFDFYQTPMGKASMERLANGYAASHGNTQAPENVQRRKVDSLDRFIKDLEERQDLETLANITNLFNEVGCVRLSATDEQKAAVHDKLITIKPQQPAVSYGEPAFEYKLTDMNGGMGVVPVEASKPTRRGRPKGSPLTDIERWTAQGIDMTVPQMQFGDTYSHSEYVEAEAGGVVKHYATVQEIGNQVVYVCTKRGNVLYRTGVTKP